MKILVVIPISEELDTFQKEWVERGFRAEDFLVGRLPVTRWPDLGVTLAQGGLGKVRFGVHTQHLLDVEPDWDLVICAGAAGALVGGLSAADVVVGTETVEHDIRNRFGEPIVPRFGCAATVVASLRHASLQPLPFKVHFGPIASGDEDVVDHRRREGIHKLTGALAVAWEGAGGARACRFSDVPFVEIRGVTDNADGTASRDFETNLETAMRHVARLIVTWVKMLAKNEEGR